MKYLAQRGLRRYVATLPPGSGPDAAKLAVSRYFNEAPSGKSERKNADQMSRALTIALFGKMADAIGTEFRFETETPCSVGELKGRLASCYPELKEQLLGPRVRVCVADTLVPDSFVIDEGRVEILSPVSGG